MNNSERPLDRVEAYKVKFKQQMDEHVKTIHKLNPEMSSAEAKEEWLINKIAVLLVGSEELGKRIQELETKLNNENT